MLTDDMLRPGLIVSDLPRIHIDMWYLISIKDVRLCTVMDNEGLVKGLKQPGIIQVGNTLTLYNNEVLSSAIQHYRVFNPGALFSHINFRNLNLQQSCLFIAWKLAASDKFSKRGSCD